MDNTQTPTATPTPVTIRQVRNGYVVIAKDIYKSDVYSQDDMLVFQTRSALLHWLLCYFTHTTTRVDLDALEE